MRLGSASGTPNFSLRASIRPDQEPSGAGIQARIAGLEVTPDYTLDAADLKVTGKDMDVLIYKTALMVEKCPDWLTLGDAAAFGACKNPILQDDRHWPHCVSDTVVVEFKNAAFQI